MKQKFYVRILAIVALSVFAMPFFANAQSEQQVVVGETNLFEELAKPDSVTGATVEVFQNAQLEYRILRQKVQSMTITQRGYRVQVFSSNNSQSAREQAFKVEKNLLEKLPNLEVYVTYSAPFWKVRIGNCVTHEEAQLLKESMIGEFPEYQTEMYIVPDRIILK